MNDAPRNIKELKYKGIAFFRANDAPRNIKELPFSGERCPEKYKGIAFFRVNDAPRNRKELPFSCFQILKEGWRTAKAGSEHVTDPRIKF